MRVLAIGCHPDDLEIACGGTLRKYVEQGAEVYMCHGVPEEVISSQTNHIPAHQSRDIFSPTMV